MKNPSQDNALAWAQFAQEASLTESQSDLFTRYYLLLSLWNKKVNLTTIISQRDVIDYHFKDSLQLHKIIDLDQVTHAVDIGTGAGFPGIALAIKYPYLHMTLIEVNAKKIQFLDEVITQLGLSNRITIFDEDWRSFLRNTNEAVQLFCARASLQPEELIRVFKPASHYKNTDLVYWAAIDWKPSPIIARYITKQITYMVGTKKRRLVLLQNTKDMVPGK